MGSSHFPTRMAIDVAGFLAVALSSGAMAGEVSVTPVEQDKVGVVQTIDSTSPPTSVNADNPEA